VDFSFALYTLAATCRALANYERTSIDAVTIAYYSTMTTWYEICDEVREAYNTTGASPLFFRGHSDASWPLVPTLARHTHSIMTHTKLPSSAHVEENLYFEFVTHAGELLRRELDAWDHLFSMQHHGVPTRLLDWTECFAVAVHFALKDATGDAAIWILNPFLLNNTTMGAAKVVRPTVLGDYFALYIARTAKVQKRKAVVALYPLRHNLRVFQQRSGFTLYNNLSSSLEDLYPESVKKIVLPVSVHADARAFLLLAGISEFTLFPDLDGLSRQVKMRYVG